MILVVLHSKNDNNSENYKPTYNHVVSSIQFLNMIFNGTSGSLFCSSFTCAVIEQVCTLKVCNINNLKMVLNWHKRIL